LGEFVEIAGARVVAEAFPKFEDACFGRGGEGGEIGEGFEPAGEVGQDGFDLRLLQHELADDGFVGRWGIAPWECAGVGAIPAEQGGLEVGFGGEERGDGRARHGRRLAAKRRGRRKQNTGEGSGWS